MTKKKKKRKKKWKETHQTSIWLKPRNHSKECKKKNQKSGVLLYCVLYLCNVWLDQQCLKKTSFCLFVFLSTVTLTLNFFFFFDRLTLMFEEHRLLEFVVERWVSSERVFIAFGTQGALILPSSVRLYLREAKPFGIAGFQEAETNQQLICLFS